MNKYTFTLIVFFCLLGAVLLLAWNQAVETANTLLAVAMWAIIAVLVLLPVGLTLAGLGLGLWFLSNRFIDNRQKWAEANLLVAQARQAAKNADNLVITAKAGEQVYIASDEDVSGRAITALHLQRAYRSNGNGDAPTQLESAAWAVMQQLHSTATRPKNITNNHAAQLPAGEKTEDAALPKHLDLLPLIGGQASDTSASLSASLNRITIWQTPGEAGQLEILTMPLTEMVHLGMVGSSGWGKSVGVQSLALQLALATERLFKTTSMRPIIRRQLSSRLAYHVGDHWQAQGLGMGKEAVELNTKGRAWAIFPGRQKTLVQTPYIDAPAIEGLLAQAGRVGEVPSVAMPTTQAEPEPTRSESLSQFENNLTPQTVGGLTLEFLTSVAVLAFNVTASSVRPVKAMGRVILVDYTLWKRKDPPVPLLVH